MEQIATTKRRVIAGDVVRVRLDSSERTGVFEAIKGSMVRVTLDTDPQPIWVSAAAVRAA